MVAAVPAPIATQGSSSPRAGFHKRSRTNLGRVGCGGDAVHILHPSLDFRAFYRAIIPLKAIVGPCGGASCDTTTSALGLRQEVMEPLTPRPLRAGCEGAYWDR